MPDGRSDAKVVESDRGKEVLMSYQRACREYAIGSAAAFFMAATVLAYAILWKEHVPEAVYNMSVPFFVVFSATGFLMVLIGYTSPTWFYKLTEGNIDV